MQLLVYQCLAITKAADSINRKKGLKILLWCLYVKTQMPRIKTPDVDKIVQTCVFTAGL